MPHDDLQLEYYLSAHFVEGIFTNYINKNAFHKFGSLMNGYKIIFENTNSEYATELL